MFTIQMGWEEEGEWDCVTADMIVHLAHYIHFSMFRMNSCCIYIS
jgi:hypothetical protein